MLTLLKKPKAAAALSAERQTLAERIAELQAAKAALAENDRTREEAEEKVWEAIGKIESADAALAKAADEATEYVKRRAQGRAGDPPGLHRRGPSPEQRKARAEQDLATWRAIRQASTDVVEDLQRSLKIAETNRSAAVAAVVAAEAAAVAEPLLARLAVVAAEEDGIRIALHRIKAAGLFRGDLGDRIDRALGRFGEHPRRALSDYLPPGIDADPTHLCLQVAFDRLKEDATAALPTAEVIAAARMTGGPHHG